MVAGSNGKGGHAASISFILVAVLVLSVFVYAAYWPTKSPTSTANSVKNLLANGDFENGICFQRQFVNASTPRCTSGWTVSTNHDYVSPKSLSRLVNQSGHIGGRALEFKVEKVHGNVTIYAAQWLNQSGCAAGDGRTFGLKMQKGLWFSFWYKGSSLSGVSLEATVVFHNGSSKLAVIYHLEPSTNSGYQASGLPLSTPHDEAAVDIYLNSATSSWKQSSFDLYAEFVKFFGVDPILNHYCVNYVAIGLGQQSSGPGVNASGYYAYGYFDDIELYVKE